MKSIRVLPGKRKGSVLVPLSKSHLHRLLVADFLAGGDTYRHGLESCEDVDATRRCLLARAENTGALPVLDCGESGSTLRFMLPVAMAKAGKAIFTAGGRLPQRPLQPFLELLSANGVFVKSGSFPLQLEGRLKPGLYEVPGDISSQIITGLLFALPILEGDSVIRIKSPLQSRGYVDMTLSVLAKYGIAIEETPDGFSVRGGQKYAGNCDLEAERDWSSAAFWIAMNELGSQIRIDGMDSRSCQPDRAIAWLSRQDGGTIDVSQCPDLFPVLAALAAVRGVPTRFTGVRRLRMKESDRLAAMADVLRCLDVPVRMAEDSFVVDGRGTLPDGGVMVNPRNDHRIAMAAAVLATVCRKPLEILDPDCTAKSYPDFFSQLERLESL